MIEALALVAGLALAITGSVLAETRRPLPEGSWRWAIPRLTSFRDSYWKQNGYALMLISSYVLLLYALGDWIGPYALAAAFLMILAVMVATHAALRSRNVREGDDRSAG
jgi:hypothetical protein